MAGLPERAAILDVRRHDEWELGHVHGAVHVPPARVAQAAGRPARRRAVAHCASGYRAGIAASLLDRENRAVVLVDDEYQHAIDLDLTSRASS